jgi:hypothetical protein
VTPDALSVSAAIRLSPVDSIGVPVFMAGNSMYLPEMDADFNISAFMHFENEEGYELTSLIPDDYRQRKFRTGDPAPIIFWVNQAPYIVEGDAEKAKLDEIFGIRARTHPVLKDLGGMLHDARTGVFKRQQEEWLAKELEVSYGDVFLEPPSRTKYWIHRYRVALENARQLTRPPHPIDVRLRRASGEWLEKFATKAELPMISSLLGEASQGIYSVRQISEIMFAYLSNKLSTARASEIKKIAADETIRSLFAHGMYEFYIKNGLPNVPFKYGKPDFVELMKQRLAQGQESGTWEVALNLSKLLFGDRDAPIKVDDAALMYIRPILETYKKVLREAESRYAYNGMKFTSEGLLDHSRVIVDCFDRIQELGCIMNGIDRKNGSMMDGRFQVDEHDVQWYRNYLES